MSSRPPPPIAPAPAALAHTRPPGRGLALALPAVIVGAVAVGFSPVFVRLSELGPSATAFYRLLLALPALWLWMRIEARGLPPRDRPGRREIALVVLAGLLFAGDLAFWHWSILLTSVANATLFANFAPIIVTFGAWALFRERITMPHLAGLGLALGGAVMLVGASAGLDMAHVAGDGLGLVTALFFGSYILVVKLLRRALPTAVLMFWSSVVTCLALLPVAWAFGESVVPPSLYAWAVLLALALVSQALGQGLIAYGLGHLPAGYSSIVILLEPVTAAVLGWALLGEALGPLQAAGGGAVLAGIVVARRGRTSRQGG